MASSNLKWNAGDNIVTTAVEFPSNMYPWMNLQSRGVQIRTILEENGRVPIDNLIDAIEETVFGDFEHLANIAKERELNLETFDLVISEAVKTRTGKAMLITTGLVVCIVLVLHPMAVVSPFLATLGFTEAGPAAGKML